MQLRNRSRRAFGAVVWLCTVGTVALSCAHKEGERVARNAPASTDGSAESPPVPPPTIAFLEISAGVQKKCGLSSHAKDASAPDFRASKLLPRGNEVLEQLANCVRRHVLDGPGLTIIGNPDPHGPDAFRRMLGMERAGAVEEYLVSHGVARYEIEMQSYGNGEEQDGGSSNQSRVSRVVIEERMAR